MSVSVQVYAVAPETLSALRSDAGAAEQFMSQNHGHDIIHDDFETLSLDKSGLGILEACGVVTQSSDPPESWVLGAGPIEAVPGQSCGCLDAEQTASVAGWISTISDEESAERAGSQSGSPSCATSIAAPPARVGRSWCTSRVEAWFATPRATASARANQRFCSSVL